MSNCNTISQPMDNNSIQSSFYRMNRHNASLLYRFNEEIDKVRVASGNLNTSNGNRNHSVNKVSSSHLKERTQETIGNGAEDTLRADSLAENQVIDKENSQSHVANNHTIEHDPMSANVVVFRPEPVAGPSGLQQQLDTGLESQGMEVDRNKSVDHRNSSRSFMISSKRSSALYDDGEYEDFSNDELPHMHSAEPQRKRKKGLAKNSNTGKYTCVFENVKRLSFGNS